MSSGRLNLFLEGLFTIVEEDLRLAIAVPQVDEHSYLIGIRYFGGMKAFGPGNYEFLGLTPGSGGFDEYSCAMINQKTINATAPPAYAVFVLPLPNAVYPRRFVSRGTNVDFQGTDASQIQANRFPLVDVLTYDFADLQSIQISGLPGFSAAYKPGTDYVNVHLFAAALSGHSAMGVSTAFHEMISDLLPNAKLDLYVNNATEPDPEDPTGIPGVDPTELITPNPPSPAGAHMELHPDDCIKIVVHPTG
jgi:hypothetical protein